MTAALAALCVDAQHPDRLTDFWGQLLGWRQVGDDVLEPTDDTGFRLRFTRTHEPKTRQNRMHFDLTSASPDAQRATVARALELGAGHADVGQRDDEGHVVLADPEGNEFCVIEAGNAFLAECGFVGALACDGTREVGRFWSAALDWPLVWDQDEETAIRSPHGGPKITWGGPPAAPQTGRGRLHFDLVAAGDRDAEVLRLVALGATVVRRPQTAADPVRMVDPDGTAFCLLT